MSATQYKRVVLEGPVRNRQDGTFYIGAEEDFIDANLIDATLSHVKSVTDIPAPKPEFVVGGLYRTAAGSVVIRTTNPERPWRIVIPRQGGFQQPGEEYYYVSEPVTRLNGPVTLGVYNGKVVAK